MPKNAITRHTQQPRYHAKQTNAEFMLKARNMKYVSRVILMHTNSDTSANEESQLQKQQINALTLFLLNIHRDRRQALYNVSKYTRVVINKRIYSNALLTQRITELTSMPAKRRIKHRKGRI
jgi:hypothetical protein